MAYSIRAKQDSPWKGTQKTLIANGDISNLSNLQSRDDAFRDRTQHFPKIRSVSTKRRPSDLSDMLDDFDDPEPNPSNYKEQFMGYLTKIKRQQLLELDKRRFPGLSPLKKAKSKD